MPWDFKGDRPIYAQLVEEIELRIISGFYPAGEKLPSVRDLAAEAAVNPNTMQRALSELERNGLVYTQRTSGRYITDDSTLIQQVKEGLARAEILAFFEKMRGFGYDVPQTLALLECAKEEVH